MPWQGFPPAFAVGRYWMNRIDNRSRHTACKVDVKLH